MIAPIAAPVDMKGEMSAEMAAPLYGRRRGGASARCLHDLGMNTIQVDLPHGTMPQASTFAVEFPFPRSHL
jgi:hypothetical protein